nr:hypothetical protein [Rhodopirellula sp. SM50]
MIDASHPSGTRQRAARVETTTLTRHWLTPRAEMPPVRHVGERQLTLPHSFC